MTATGLRTLATEYLRYVRGCYCISYERSPWTTPGIADREAWSQKPDVLGLLNNRFTLEIEIKISRSDFLHDEKKSHRKAQSAVAFGKTQRYVNGPNYLYYLVPSKLLQVVTEYAPQHAGILSPSDKEFDKISGLPVLSVVRKASRIHSCRLNLHDTVVMVRDMAGSVATMARNEVRHLVTKARQNTLLDELEEDFRKYVRTHKTRTSAMSDEDRTTNSSLIRARNARSKRRKV